MSNQIRQTLAGLLAVTLLLQSLPFPACARNRMAAVQSAGETTQPGEETTPPTKGALHPTEGAVHPTEGALHPTEGAANPTEGTADPTEGTANPTEEVTQPTDETTQPTENSALFDEGSEELDDAAAPAEDAQPEEQEPVLAAADGSITINTSADLVNLSKMDAAEYQNAVIRIARNEALTLGNDFQGLGTVDYPFMGSVNITNGDSSTITISLRHPFFNSLDQQATIGTGFRLEAADNVQGPLLAEYYVNSGAVATPGEISLTITSAGDSASFGGLIGQMGDGTKLGLTVQSFSDAKLSIQNGNLGFFCNTMRSNAELTLKITEKTTLPDITGSSGSVGGLVGAMGAGAKLTVDSAIVVTSVTGNGGSVGGLVGEMGAGASLTVNFPMTVTNVTGNGGNAGGLVGRAEQPTITLNEAVTLSGRIQGVSTVGGYIGCAAYTDDTTLDLSKLNYASLTLNGGNHTGGVFGVLNLNNPTGGTLTICKADTVFSHEGSSWQLGGIIGQYSAYSTKSALRLEMPKANIAKGSATALGGILGLVADDGSDMAVAGAKAAYIKIDGAETKVNNASCEYFGGLVAEMGQSGHILFVSGGTVTGTGNGTNGIGGILGQGKGGFLRLSGETNLSGFTFAQTGIGCGQIAGEIDGTVVYAMGSGNGGEGDYYWNFLRPTSAPVSDVGSYGEVIRLNAADLKEGADGTTDSNVLFYVNQNEHTITLSTVNSTNIATKRDLAALAIGMQRGDVLLDTNITLTANIDLTGTGIYALLRDNDSQTYTGTFDGSGHTLTVAAGEAYGVVRDEIGKGQIYNHSTLGWIPVCNGTVENLTLAGTITLGNVGGGKAVYCGALAGKTEGMTANTVTVNTAIDIHDAGSGTFPDVCAGGFLGYSETGTLTFDSCTMQGSIHRETGNHSFDIGGFAGRLKNNTVTFNSCKLAGTGEANRPNVDFISTSAAPLAKIGGLVSYAENATIEVDSLTVNGFQMKSFGTTNSGGLFGSSWVKTNVTVKDSTIKDSTLDCGSRFGGLVYSTSGYWQIDSGTTAGITFQKGNAFTGKTAKDNPSALLIAETSTDSSSKTYLEILYGGLKFDSAPTVTLDNAFFDDLVGKSKYADGNNSVVSIGLTAQNAAAPVLIDTTENGCNTWKNQCIVNDAATYTNGQTRYYYNVDYYRAKGLGKDAAGDFLLWSLKQYAGINIAGYFNGKIAGDIDLTGVSYYPVPIAPGSNDLTLEIANATVTFDYAGMNDKENNRKFDRSNLQHYQMHTGILSTVTALKDRTAKLTVTDLTLKGTFGKYTDTAAGALICSGVTSGGAVASITVRNIRLDGIYCANTAGEPLLIHSIGSTVTLGMENVYTVLGSYDTVTKPAATALIGAVGGKDAEAINLTFSKMGLEGDRGKSIFSKATFAESFRVKTDGKASSGTYNFDKNESVVTYGKEISNGAFKTDWNRNSYDGSGAGQVWYYDTFGGDIYVSPAGGASTPYDFSGYLPYIGVYEHVDGTSTYRELDVNQQVVILVEGCGTYGHPWEIKEASQLMAAARILEGSYSNIALKIDPDALTDKLKGQNETISYIHDSASQKANEDMVLVYSGSGWKQAQVDENGHYAAVSGGKDYSADQILAYVRNGYYQICKDMTLDMSQFSGLGGNDWDCKQAFSGVIVGKANDSGNYPTITLKGKNPTGQAGGLIRYSQGSVVKDLNIKFQDVEIAVNNANGIRTDKTFFGGVIGMVKGGDNIIDKVTVSDSGVTITGNETQLTAVGGYVGVVGGNASSAKKNGSYVNSDIRNGGGVVFRNISSEGLQSITNDAAKYYWNPYIGRVLDGYACAEASCGNLNNTDKNYKIPTLSDEKLEIMPGNKDPKNGVDLYPNSTVKINSEQDIWLLSAIVNSGFGGKTIDTRYSDSTVDYRVRASYYGRVRTGSYAGVGTAPCTGTDLEDEKDYWGGATDGSRIQHSASYLSTYVTSTAPVKAVVNSLSVAMGGRTIQFAGKKYDMTGYGNGFRGIGRGYMELPEYQVRRIGFIQLSKVTGLQGIGGSYPVIKYERTLNDYGSEKDLHEPSAGFFSMVYGNGSNAVTVENLIFEGTITRAKVSTDQASGVVIGKTSFANTKINFTNVTVQNSSITSAVYGAGLLAYSDQAVSFTVQNCQVKGLETDKVNHAGGFLGYVANKTDTQVTFTNCAAVKTALKGVQYGGLYAGQILVPCTVTGGSAGDEENISSITEKTGNTDACRLGGLIGNAGSTLTVNAETPDANPITPVTIRNIRINSSGGTSTSSSIGGVAGYVTGTADIQNVSVQDVTLVGKNMGGILGQAAGGAKMKNVSVCKSTLANCRTDNIQGRNTGGLIGELSGGSFTGFQLLSRNNLIGYLVGSNGTLGTYTANQLLDETTIGLSTASSKYTPYNGNISTVALDAPCGIWVGNANNNEVRLVAVSRIGDYSPVKNYRRGTNGNYIYDSDVIYADYTGKANGDASKVGIMPAVPGLSPLPHTSDGVSLTSRTGIIDDTIADSLMKGYFGANPNRPLNKIVEKFAENGEYAAERVHTYRQEQGDLYTGEDFPVLVLNATNELNEIVDDYITLLTNRDETTTGHMYDTIVPATYRFNGTSWELHNDPTVVWDTSQKNLKVYSSKYDNQPGACQVTILDVQYKNPSEGSNDLYHLYIPVYVKKVMDVYFDVKMANGAAGYDGAYSDTSVLANFGEYFTADLTFTYRWSREEWSYLLESGQNLLWNYSKTIQLAELNTAADTEIFSKAHMTLVDGNTRANTPSTAYLNKDNLTVEDRTVSLTLDGTKIPGSHYLCDLLPLKKTSGSRYKEVPADSKDASVRIWTDNGYVYYAPRTAEDPSEATDCDITLDTQETTLDVREQYYLVMYFESGSTQARYNWEMKLSGTPTGQIPLFVKERDTNIYVLGNYFRIGELTLQTASKTGEPLMKLDSNDTITVTMTSSASVQGDDVSGLSGYVQGRNLYYQYAVHLLDQDGKPVKLGGTVSPVGVKLGGTNLENTDGSPGYTMTLTENTCYINVKAPGSEFINQTFEVQLQFAYEDAGALASQFPLRTNAEGVHFAVDTRVGYLREGLEGSSMKDSKVNNTLYYMVQSANAKLTYDAYNTGRPAGTSQEDWDGNTSQLGLNAREESSAVLHTRGQYDVRSCLSLDLQNEEHANYPGYLIATLSLERKNNAGAYEPVEIETYLKDFSINSVTAYTPVDGGIQFCLPLPAETVRNLRTNPAQMNIYYTVKPGSEVGWNEFQYANYRVQLSAYLSHDAQTPQILTPSVGDYLIYTHTKVYLGIVNVVKN